MKKLMFSFLAIVLLGLFTSCGVNSSIVLNNNQNSTQVQLSSNNYKIIDRVTGSANVKYICMIGGVCKKQLYENAYSDMMTKANLKDGSKAVINIVTEEHIGGIPPFYYKRTITVSANVIEFTR